MMKTATVQLSELISSFTASQTDYILNIEDVLEMEDATETFLRDLRNLLNPKRGMNVPTLRRLFSEGFTMMMVPSSQFDILEAAYADGEEFSLVVKDDKKTLCILCASELVW